MSHIYISVLVLLTVILPEKGFVEKSAVMVGVDVKPVWKPALRGLSKSLNLGRKMGAFWFEHAREMQPLQGCGRHGVAYPA